MLTESDGHLIISEYWTCYQVSYSNATHYCSIILASKPGSSKKATVLNSVLRMLHWVSNSYEIIKKITDKKNVIKLMSKCDTLNDQLNGEKEQNYRK